jgi:hypothetical protein
VPDLIHDFVYLSNQKLADLVVQTSTIQTKRLSMRAEVRSPVVSLILASSSLPTNPGSTSARIAKEELAKLDKAIEAINRRSLWYSDATVQAGSWIYFETQMNYCLLQSRYFNSAVVFADNMNLLTDPSIRLLLHGSARHLLGRPKLVDVSTDVERMRTSPSSGEFVYVLADNVEEVVRTIHASQDPINISPSSRSTNSLSSGIAQLLRVLDQKFVTDTAAWLGGVARVTASVNARGGLRNVERFVMATPLYVEYVTAPENQYAEP